MTRPYLNHSIDQLEAAVESAAGDPQALAAIVHELGFRKTARARELAEMLGASQKTKGASRPGPTPSASRPAGKGKARAGGSKHAPTEEQREAIDAFLRGGSIKINAYAGAGKTSTLQMIAHATEKRGQYIAFNRSIVADAKDKFPKTVNCSTLHGLAFRATPSEYRAQEDKLIGSLNPNQLAEILGLTKNWRIDETHSLQPRSQAYLILETVRRFTQSAETEPLAAHVPRHGSLVAAKESTLRAVEDFALRGARHLWSRMLLPADPIPLGHDGYLKLWALSDPLIASDYILLDEAQDTNPVVLGALRKQTAQMIYVGDRHQQIYEWRGAVNAMERIETDATTLLTRSFRFGEPIADAATRVLSVLGERAVVKGNSSVRSRICTTDPVAILGRTNAAAIAAVIESLDLGRRPHLVGGTKDFMDLLRGVDDLKRGQPSTVPEFFGFPDWNAVVEFAKSGEGGNLLMFVNLVEARGEKQLMWALGRTVEEDCCDLTISTAHKAKGREWPRVRLMDDFLRSQKGTKPDDPKFRATGGMDPAELRLFYVALTRAREEVEIPPPLAARFGIPMDASRSASRPASAESSSEAPRQPKPPPPQPAPWQAPTDWRPTPPKPTPQPTAAAARPTQAQPQPKKKGILDWLFG